ncbi:MAG: lactate utilization protein [Actinomycetota bacterium]|nr:lactate utilization protein [Actinomycetota bacterium]MDQ3429847.1 lactate utilization protein [Actinomycetota bacterium]
MVGRAEFLEKVRHRTQRGRYKPTHAPDVAWTPKDGPRRDTPIEDPPARFLEELEALGGHGIRVGSLEEARDHVLSMVRERDAKLLVRWDVEELEELGVDGPLVDSGVEVSVWRDLEDFREVAGRADVGLSTAAWAIAETGTLVLEGGPGMGRSVTLLPPTYVAVVPVEKILRTVPEAIEKYAGKRLPANVCFHTGPSRSGDIEMSLFVGMHGPGDVHVILVG